MDELITVKYISCWDGCDDIETKAKVNISTGEASEIESVDVDEEYEICVGEFVEYDDGSVEQVILNENGRYFVVSKSGEEYRNTEIHHIRFTVAKDVSDKDIHKIYGIAY